MDTTSLENTPRLAITSPKGLVFFTEVDILYCHANGNYCNLFIHDGSSYLLSKKLKAVQAQLSKTFIRIHHQYVVNTLHLVAFDKSEMLLELSDGTKLPLSVRRKKVLGEYFRIL